VNGKKTYTGIAMWLVGALGAVFFPQYAAVAAVVTTVGKALTATGAAHKLAKAAPKAEAPKE
jgi:multisubunit Na+/H+ antiporter MnhG subunit